MKEIFYIFVLHVLDNLLRHKLYSFAFDVEAPTILSNAFLEHHIWICAQSGLGILTNEQVAYAFKWVYVISKSAIVLLNLSTFLEKKVDQIGLYGKGCYWKRLVLCCIRLYVCVHAIAVEKLNTEPSWLPWTWKFDDDEPETAVVPATEEVAQTPKRMRQCSPERIPKKLTKKKLRKRRPPSNQEEISPTPERLSMEEHQRLQTQIHRITVL